MTNELTKYQQISTVPLPIEGLTRSSNFFVTRSGRIMKRVQIALPTGKIDAIVPPKDWELDELLEGSPNLSQPEILEQSLPKIPWDDPDGGVIQAWNYFASVYRKQHSEAFIWWHWDAEARKYLMVVPAFYCATGGGLEYPPHSRRYCHSCRVALYDGHEHCPHCKENGDIRPLFVLGTSHSHGTMPPFHSSGDHANELDVTGFHLTFGRLQAGPVINMEGSFVVADGHSRFRTTWDDHFQFAMTDESADRLELWLTLVGRSESGGWVVADESNQTLFTGSKERCEYWAKGVTGRVVTIQQRAQVTKHGFGSGRALGLESERTGRTRSRSIFDTFEEEFALEAAKKVGARLPTRKRASEDPGPALKSFRKLIDELPVMWHILGARYAIELFGSYVSSVQDIGSGYPDYLYLEEYMDILDETIATKLDTMSCRKAAGLWSDAVLRWYKEQVPAEGGIIRFGDVEQAFYVIDEVLSSDFDLDFSDLFQNLVEGVREYCTTK